MYLNARSTQQIFGGGCGRTSGGTTNLNAVGYGDSTQKQRRFTQGPLLSLFECYSVPLPGILVHLQQPGRIAPPARTGLGERNGKWARLRTSTRHPGLGVLGYS